MWSFAAGDGEVLDYCTQIAGLRGSASASKYCRVPAVCGFLLSSTLLLLLIVPLRILVRPLSVYCNNGIQRRRPYVP
jgi:hypothetical protein